MTPEESRKAAAVMLAFADGKPIQYRYRGTSEWLNFQANPCWNWDRCEYRVKPEPRVAWLSISAKTGAVISAKREVRAGETYSCQPYRKFVEVLEGDGYD